MADAVKAAFDRKELPTPEPGAMCYMMSKQQYLNDRGKHWHPHLMFFLPLNAPATWGANLPGSPVIGIKDDLDQLTLFLIPVGTWSDGTAAPTMDEALTRSPALSKVRCRTKVRIESITPSLTDAFHDSSRRSLIPDKKKNPWVQVGRYSQLALMLPAGTVMGWLLGSALDRWLHTSWISIVGLFLGIAAGMIELIRSVLRDTK